MPTIEGLQVLLEIRDRKIKLLEDEVALLKKILGGFQNGPRCDSGQDKWPVGCCGSDPSTTN